MHCGHLAAPWKGYHGDEIVAFWGSPVPSADHAVPGMPGGPGHPGPKSPYWMPSTTSPGKPHLHVKCGLQTGKLFVGELSPRRPPAYNFIGMAAGIASTLEGANTRFGTAILVGGQTYEQAQDSIEARPVGQLKSRRHPRADHGV